MKIRSLTYGLASVLFTTALAFGLLAAFQLGRRGLQVRQGAVDGLEIEDADAARCGQTIT